MRSETIAMVEAEARDRAAANRAEQDRMAARIAELEAALKPFAYFGDNVDDGGWTSTIHREQISTWFGPSDFRQAKQVLNN